MRYVDYSRGQTYPRPNRTTTGYGPTTLIRGDLAPAPPMITAGTGCRKAASGPLLQKFRAGALVRIGGSSDLHATSGELLCDDLLGILVDRTGVVSRAGFGRVRRLWPARRSRAGRSRVLGHGPHSVGEGRRLPDMCVSRPGTLLGRAHRVPMLGKEPWMPFSPSRRSAPSTSVCPARNFGVILGRCNAAPQPTTRRPCRNLQVGCEAIVSEGGPGPRGLVWPAQQT